jgi:cytochrome c biogenesis protein ResB
MGLKLLLDREADGTGVVIVIPYRIIGTAADGQPIEDLYQAVDLHRGDSKVSQGLDLSIGLTDFGEFTLLIAKRDPGQGLVWLAFGLLIAGITISFYRPRRRVWTRLAPDGRLGIVWRSDRYVDVEREFGRLLDQLVAARRPS